MIDAMFQEGTDRALDDQLQRPAPFKPDPAPFKFGQLLAAPFQGVSSGSTKSAAFGAEIAGAFGETMASTNAFGGGGMFAPLTDEERKQGNEAYSRVQKGEIFSNPAGNELRAAAKNMMPDPQTTHAATQVVAGIAELGAQAVTYRALAGPAAPFLLGADVGMAEADKLKQQGVDVATRTKAGAVAGAVDGVSIALPVAVPGSVAKTTAAVVAGGPGGFIAQNAAEKAILDSAGYEKIGNTYDPLEPTGLLLSTIVPAGFGAVAVRGARGGAKSAGKPPAAPVAPEAAAINSVAPADRVKLRYDDPRLDEYAVAAAQREGIPPEALLAIKNAGERSGPQAVSPVGARGVMQFMPDTWKAYGKGDITDPINSIDAGARYMKDLIRQYDGNVRAAIAHYNGGGRAGKAVLEGRAPPAKETQGYLARTDEFMGGRATEAAAQRAVAADPDTVAAARVRQTLNAIESYKLTPAGDLAGATAHADAMEVAHAQMARGESVNVTDLLNLEPVRTGRLLDDMIATGEEARGPLAADAGRFDPAAVQRLSAEVDQLRAQRPDVERLATERAAAEGIPVEQSRAAVQADMASRIAENEAQVQRLQAQIGEQQRYQRAGEDLARVEADLGDLRAARGDAPAAANTPRTVALRAAEVFRPEPTPAARVARTTGEPRATPARPPENTGDAATESVAQPAARPGAEPSAEPGAQALDAGTAAALEANPDLMVQLEGMDKPMRAAELLEQVKKEAADDVKDSPLLDVAANCFLRHV